ncbi:MAG TPA: LptF/LptG family permease [Vicinamibacterales bacterium]|nr:LptF/LptG family permease [Vicinamibacterales bacterium]
MFRTIDRYVIREILPPLFLSLLIFTFILVLPPFMDQLEALVSKGVSWPVVGRMLLTLVPQALGLTIPMALLVGLLIGLGRLSADREVVALLACGVSPYRLLRPVLILALGCGLANLYVMIRAIPDANQTFRQLSYDIITKRVENDIHPQVFFDDFPGWVLYVRDVTTGGGSWRDVLVADTRKPDRTVIYLARRGQLNLNRAAQRVDLILEDGTQYSSNPLKGGEVQTYRFPKELIVALDPNSVFPRMELQRGINELTIPELRAQAADKAAHGLSPHQEIMAIQQKFSFPAACLVFAIIGLALGLTVARESKLSGFVVGIAVIFAYYVLLYLAEALTKGHLVEPHVSRWVPNLVLLPIGVAALVWRTRWAEGRLPFQIPARLTALFAWARSRTGTPPAAGAARRGRVVVVVRLPRLEIPAPSILDRYISRIYLRTTAVSFVALLGIFYIANFLDRSDKLFKGQATGAMLVRLLAYYTPQYIYYVIPLAALISVLVTFGLLSRTSELSVMKACGISIYRAALPLVLLSLVWSGVLFGLEQQILARANRRADALDAEIRGRAPRIFNVLNRRWLVGRSGDIYHYGYYDAPHGTLNGLTIYRPDTARWQLASETYAARAVYRGGGWTANAGWVQQFSHGESWRPFTERALPLESPDYFATEQPVTEMMTVGQLRRYIDELAASGFNIIPLTVDLQRKLAFPFVTLVMTLLAVPFGMTTGKRGTLYGIGIGIVMALAYWVVGGAFAAIGKAGLLEPMLAAWAPNVIVAGSAAYMLLVART